MRDCPAKFVIRKWIPMPLEAEFRAFVNNGKLTAVSQYYHFIVFPKLLAQRVRILVSQLIDTR